MQRRDGTPMTYWGTIPLPSQCQTLAGLLAQADGSCVAWSQLFDQALEVQGIDSASVVEVTANPNIVPGAEQFLVKDWTFTGLGTSGNSDFPYIVGIDAMNEDGVPGQGNVEPPPAFENHFVVRFGGQIYDPSYGIGPFNSENEHENAAIDGFLTTDGFFDPRFLVRGNNLGVQELQYIG